MDIDPEPARTQFNSVVTLVILGSLSTELEASQIEVLYLEVELPEVTRLGESLERGTTIFVRERPSEPIVVTPQRVGVLVTVAISIDSPRLRWDLPLVEASI